MIKGKPDSKLRGSDQDLQVNKEEVNRSVVSSVDFYNNHLRKVGEPVLNELEYKILNAMSEFVAKCVLPDLKGSPLSHMTAIIDDKQVTYSPDAGWTWKVKKKEDEK